ncbi:uncharacterized protein [Rutidosis leptorrhynchoides]|uniref:uncharacterized protein n=1 Tax=Rutidosis leptorrhynchoides TaxID=125765 RepID=UPI003A996FA5
MESPQSVLSPFKNSSLVSDHEKQNLDLFPKNSTLITKKPEPEPKPETYIGVLEVHIHQARDIQNICIYQKQDVYAKICITSNPEKYVTTRTINGGGNNPVFNETLQIKVPTIESSLKCEIYMLSRVRTYLEDQLLGFTLIPLSEILMKNGNLDKEFTLSSTDLFHSPSGFVHLSLSYTGASPDVIAIPPPAGANGTPTPTDLELSEFDKIEFPDPKIVNENHMMVTEYFGLGSDSLASSDTDDKIETAPVMSVSANGSQCASGLVITTDSNSKPTNQEYESSQKVGDAKSDSSSAGLTKNPNVTVNVDLEKKVVQQDFVDLYMKSMQQFTESLAKMKLPLAVDKEGTDSGNSGSDQKNDTPNGAQSRVFYGSRAFF